MPCNCDHMEPTAAEKHNREAAALLWYVLTDLKLHKSPEYKWVKQAKDDIYGGGDGDRVTAELCSQLRKLEKEQPYVFDDLVYNARIKESRRLADWWEEHCEIDEQRLYHEGSGLFNAFFNKLNRSQQEAVEIYFTRKEDCK